MLKKSNKQKLDVREHWWVKLPWMYGLRSQGEGGVYEKKKKWKHYYKAEWIDGKLYGVCHLHEADSFELTKPPVEPNNLNIAQAYFEEQWQDEFMLLKKPPFLQKGYEINHCTNPSLLALERKQYMDTTAFLLLPIYHIVRQGAEVKGEKGEEDKIQYEVPAGITALFEEHVRKVKIWLKHGLSYIAVLQRYGGFVGAADRENYSAFFAEADDKRTVSIHSLPTQLLLYDKPGQVEGRTHYFNNNYENYRQHADAIIKEFLPEDAGDLFIGFEGIDENPLFKNVEVKN